MRGDFGDKGPSVWDLEEMHVCFTDGSYCLDCGAMTISDALHWEILENEGQISQLQALEILMRDACVFGRKFYTSDGHPIPLSSYLPRKGDPLDTRF